MQLNIKVILCLNINVGWTFVDNYSPFPQPVTGYNPLNDITVSGITPSSPDGFPLKSDIIVFSDDKAYLESLPYDRAINLYPVYVGESSNIESSKCTQHLYDIWPAEESEQIRRLRFDRLLHSIKGQFDGWLYENILTIMNDSVPDMIWFKDRNGLHWRVNNSFCDVVQKTKDDCRGKTHGYIWGVPEEEGLACQESEETVMKSGKTCEFEEPVKTTDGLKQFKVYKSPIYDRFGDIAGTAGIGHDITNFSNMGLELSLLVENLPLPIVICDPKWNTVRFNSMFKSISNIDGDGLLLNYLNWKSTHLNPVKNQNLNSDVSAEYTLGSSKDAHTFLLTEKEIRDYFGNISGYFCLFRDITLERENESRILTLANTDALTGLYNRRYFYDHLREMAGSPMTLLYMDLDFFKSINDTYGHARGDEVLKKTADFIREVFPEGVAARLGGDEYALLLDRIMDDQEFSVKEKILQEKVLSLFRRHEPGDLYVTISIGKCSTDGSKDDSNPFNVDQFLHQADDSMYEAKRRHHTEQNRIS